MPKRVQILLPGWGVGIRTLYRPLHLLSGPRLYCSNLLGDIFGVYRSWQLYSTELESG